MDCSNSSELWNVQGDDLCFQKESNFDISQCLLDGVSQNQEDLSYMFDEATPAKACGDFSYLATRGENKGPEEFRLTSQIKRRRQLQFNTQDSCPTFSSGEIPAFLKSKEIEDTVEEILPDPSQWVSGLPDTSASDHEVLDRPSEGWLAEFFNDVDMHLDADDMNLSGVSEAQIDITEYCNIPSECEANMAQEKATRTPQKAGFKGRKAYVRAPMKIASSVAYPFAFIKPCAFHGDVTLKDINQRIRTPPPNKSKQGNEDFSGSYPTSAFSGKPVVGKTKIRTDGGKGSITIMRTRG